LAVAFAISTTVSAIDVNGMSQDKVDSLSGLPGWPANATFEIYSGFIDIENTSKSIHYVFLES